MSRKSILWRDTSVFLSFSRDMTEQSRGLKTLELTMLREECAEKDLEEHYLTYIRRLHTSQLSSFIMILIFNVFLHVILIMVTLSPTEREFIYQDITLCVGISCLVICILSINFFVSLQKRWPCVAYVTTVFAVLLLIIMDTSIPFTHTWYFNFTIPLYHVLTILSIYFFMPIDSYIWTITLAISTTICYIVFYKFFVYCSDGPAIDMPKLISEAIFLLGINILGIFVRVSREVVTRMIFLDKRQCIEEKLLFYAAKDQERNLLLSMIPKQIAKQMEVDVRMRIEMMKNTKAPKQHTIDDVRKLFIEPHEDVTILYADIVNYTHLTTTLDVKTLVGTLHDLYVRFDDAANAFNVLRIQFLGDCYYCVANVSMPNEHHANSCVKLGLRMINEIRTVRFTRQLEIDMRIGVHSGSVLSGVIGAYKWQFDIYSRDVDIANRLESTGEPGRVHISAATLGQLDGKFQYEDGTARARDDPILRKYQITTFLIKENQTRKSLYQFPTEDSDQSISETNSLQRMKDLVALEIGQETIRMPINSVIAHYKHLFFGQARRVTPLQQEVKNFYSNISWLFMWYKNWRWELSYMQQTDIMHKYSLGVAHIIILCTIVMQAVNLPQTMFFWVLVIIGNIFLLVTMILVWFKKCWSIFFSTLLLTRPFKGFDLWLYTHSDKVQRNLKIRTSIWLVSLILQLSYCLTQLLDCDRFRYENAIIEMQAHEEDIANTICFNPWALTESIVLNLGIVFLFTHISYTLKWIICSTVLISYSIITFVMFAFIFEISISSNQYFFPEYAHIIFVLTAAFAFHMVTREIEFISRMDYNWKHELRKKKEHAKFTNETISILVSNILPSHIVDIYMRDQLTSDLYYEEYENVSVMFATIQNFDTEMVGMRILNEIICDFDQVLGTYQGRNKVEKIKVASWTYMAACGLNASETLYRKNQVLQKERTRSELRLTVFDDTERLSKKSPDDGDDNISLGNDFVYVITCFALDLLRCMRVFNDSTIQGEDKTRTSGALRIGISNGPIMAGVVGLYKPFYDIWGNAVNMASRMDSTGQAGSIQVTEETALILKSYNIKSTFRGQTFVKGRGKIPTYFVDIDENLHFN